MNTSELNGLFIFVSEQDTKAFNVDYKMNPEKYYNKIIFVSETKEIITHGTVFNGSKF